jgi:hypothetical protein
VTFRKPAGGHEQVALAGMVSPMDDEDENHGHLGFNVIHLIEIKEIICHLDD